MCCLASLKFREDKHNEQNVQVSDTKKLSCDLLPAKLFPAVKMYKKETCYT